MVFEQDQKPRQRSQRDGTVVVRMTRFLIRLRSPAIIAGMSREGELDYQRQAEAAMKMAAATTGFERLKWVRVAQAWHELAAVRARLAVANVPVLPTTRASY
jgi:hypothetical protein